MAKVQQVCLDEVVGYFDDLEDPRSTVNLKHPLVSVVVIAMMAVLGWRSRTDRYREVGRYQRGVPFEGVEVAEWDSAQGCFSTRAGTFEAGRVSSLLCELAHVVACEGSRHK